MTSRPGFCAKFRHRSDSKQPLKPACVKCAALPGIVSLPCLERPETTCRAYIRKLPLRKIVRKYRSGNVGQEPAPRVPERPRIERNCGCAQSGAVSNNRIFARLAADTFFVLTLTSQRGRVSRVAGRCRTFGVGDQQKLRSSSYWTVTVRLGTVCDTPLIEMDTESGETRPTGVPGLDGVPFPPPAPQAMPVERIANKSSAQTTAVRRRGPTRHPNDAVRNRNAARISRR
jgi:hypothetical protein